ncbi:hypothetical protein OHA79_04765 [Streptomyces sp. NBC_00841]|uniref:hypothetical protein n=1 Tax=unclassified Streptomyces TaxID=2593676 RepID=UPI0022558389|nr:MULTISPECIES: hypothetical protein [unclassified Streptomyces]MCX4537522.1 hypothetical protein [Streptomyces sp. NBC_01669]WRZ97264.1 hypothetical protein OHA79_04765 [Streptomyces sp. NBC_00841]
MSLSVDVFVVGEDGQVDVLDVPRGSSDLAGFERWRTSVWGSDAVRSLGASFFPALASGDLKVFPDQVTDFLAECSLIRSNLEVVAPRTDPSKTHAEYVWQISERLRNIEDAAERAQGVAGGVLIW